MNSNVQLGTQSFRLPQIVSMPEMPHIVAKEVMIGELALSAVHFLGKS